MICQTFWINYLTNKRVCNDVPNGFPEMNQGAKKQQKQHPPMAII